MDVKFDAEKEELRQKLIIEYEARLNIFKQFKVIEAGKRLNATPFKCQACSHSFATKGKYFVLILRKKFLEIKLWVFILNFNGSVSLLNSSSNYRNKFLKRRIVLL